MAFNRRNFLKSLAAVSAGGLLNPHFTFAQSNTGAGRIKNLVSIFLRGGADGITMFPYTSGPLEPIIRNARPGAIVASNQILPLSGFNQNGRSNTIGFHNEWAELLTKVNEVNCGLSIITEYGVTQNNNFSHEIAQGHFDSGTNLSPQTLERGWLANLVDTFQMPAMSTWGIGETAPLLFNSTTQRPIVVSSLGSYSFLDRDFGGFTCTTCQADSDRLSSAADDSAFKRYIEEKLVKEKHPEITLDDAMTQAASGLYSSVDIVQSKINPISVDINLFKPALGTNSFFPQQMADIAKVIFYSNSPLAPSSLRSSAKIICTQLGGWDAHANILSSYATQIRVLGGALKGLIHYLHQWGVLSSTVIQIVTEFGRTTRRNVSNGLDHAAANRVMILGGPIARGVFGPEASLEEANSMNHFTPKVAFTGIQKQILKECGFNASALDQVFKIKLPGEIELPFIA